MTISVGGLCKIFWTLFNNAVNVLYLLECCGTSNNTFTFQKSTVRFSLWVCGSKFCFLIGYMRRKHPTHKKESNDHNSRIAASNEQTITCCSDRSEHYQVWLVLLSHAKFRNVPFLLITLQCCDNISVAKTISGKPVTGDLWPIRNL